MATVWLYVATPGTPDATLDTPIYNYWSSTLGHTVSYKDPTTDTDPIGGGADVVVISESVSSATVAFLQDDAIPIVCHEGAAWDKLDMGSGGTSFGPAEDQIDITDASHYITGPFGTGLLTVRTTTDTNGSGYMTGPATGAGLADWDVDGTFALIVYDTGDTLVSGSPSTTAPERRVFIGFRYFGQVNATGKDLYNRISTWALHIGNPWQDTISVAAAVPSPTVTEKQILTPAAIGAPASIPKPEVRPLLAPDAVDTITAVPTPTIQFGAGVTASSVNAPTTVPAPTSVTGGIGTSPAAVGAVVTVPSPVEIGGPALTSLFRLASSLTSEYELSI